MTDADALRAAALAEHATLAVDLAFLEDGDKIALLGRVLSAAYDAVQDRTASAVSPHLSDVLAAGALRRWLKEIDAF